MTRQNNTTQGKAKIRQHKTRDKRQDKRKTSLSALSLVGDTASKIRTKSGKRSVKRSTTWLVSDNANLFVSTKQDKKRQEADSIRN
jgi:hypothetical protein